jgi:flagellar protein FliO/FliZ
LIIVICVLSFINGVAGAQEDTVVLPETEAGNTVRNEEQSIVISGEEAGALNNPSGLSTFFLILRFLLVLGAVAVSIYGIVFFLKKFSRAPLNQDPFLKVVARAPLGTNRSVHVVMAGSKAWLVGDTDNSVSLIAEITDQELIDAMILEESKKNAEKAKVSGFASLLRRKITGSADAPNADKLRKTRERLQGL